MGSSQSRQGAENLRESGNEEALSALEELRQALSGLAGVVENLCTDKRNDTKWTKTKLTELLKNARDTKQKIENLEPHIPRTIEDRTANWFTFYGTIQAAAGKSSLCAWFGNKMVNFVVVLCATSGSLYAASKTYLDVNCPQPSASTLPELPATVPTASPSVSTVPTASPSVTTQACYDVLGHFDVQADSSKSMVGELVKGFTQDYFDAQPTCFSISKARTFGGGYAASYSITVEETLVVSALVCAENYSPISGESFFLYPLSSTECDIDCIAYGSAAEGGPPPPCSGQWEEFRATLDPGTYYLLIGHSSNSAVSFNVSVAGL